jgi:molybdenum cofactor cytidylyltransferase
MSMVVGVVLGAGSSQRLGRPKQTLPLGDTTLLGWVVRDVERSSLDRVVVVVDAATAAGVPGLGAGRSELVEPEPAARSDGCSDSLRAGLDAAGECEAVMLLLGDMPGVDARVVDSVSAAWQRRRPWALVARYRDGLGHPFVFSRSAFPDLRRLHGDKAVWKLLERHGDRIDEARLPLSRPPDVDTQADYEKVRAALGMPGKAPARR